MLGGMRFIVVYSSWRRTAFGCDQLALALYSGECWRGAAPPSLQRALVELSIHPDFFPFVQAGPISIVAPFVQELGLLPTLIYIVHGMQTHS